MPGPLIAARYARRLAPFAMEAYRRYQNLTPEQKERYRRRAKDAASRGRQQAERLRRRPPG